MTATYKKNGDNFLPVIKHTDGQKETLHGSPLATIRRAKEYAQFEIYNRITNESSSSRKIRDHK